MRAGVAICDAGEKATEDGGDDVPNGGELAAQGGAEAGSVVFRERDTECGDAGAGGGGGVEGSGVVGGAAAREREEARGCEGAGVRGGVGEEAEVLPAGEPGRGVDNDGFVPAVPDVRQRLRLGWADCSEEWDC